MEDRSQAGLGVDQVSQGQSLGSCRMADKLPGLRNGKIPPCSPQTCPSTDYAGCIADYKI